MRAATIATVLLAALACAAEGALPRKVQDAAGNSHTIPAPGRKATVLIFTTTDCPIANAMAPEIARICDEYEKRDVAVLLVYADPQTTLEQIRTHTRDYALKCPAILDAQHQLVKFAGASVTPEAAVFSPEGRLLYRGRINDLYADYGKKRSAPLKNDLRDALDAILQNKPIAVATTEAVGCFIPPLAVKGEKQ